jgi:hypothetical protein
MAENYTVGPITESPSYRGMRERDFRNDMACRRHSACGQLGCSQELDQADERASFTSVRQHADADVET